ncbi:CbrC family protein [Streptomyces sp. TRM66268-LWL]|uniref:CbrC family protein n=1 Tax=Streptomyces polyasparticus TaxID=2767826 RepID=A0ABR7SAQ3_9ACTN|nr:CbrC family protein [Streptomyces polyasparticus]MBC9712561.1 CbrC family protein [Streptomyces polyasparticus]
MTEPIFRYHPDPVATGSASRAEHDCGVCGMRRQIRYIGPVYGRQPDSLCLHCIQSGEASSTLGVSVEGDEESGMLAMFSDAVDVPDDVPMSVVDEITRHTPGFTAWQQDSWLYHCGDGAAYLGPAGYRELQAFPEALAMLREDHQRYGWTQPESEDFLRSLDREGEPTAYLFRCLHCGMGLASWDIG